MKVFSVDSFFLQILESQWALQKFAISHFEVEENRKIQICENLEVPGLNNALDLS